MSKMKTLFAYFAKSPAPPTTKKQTNRLSDDGVQESPVSTTKKQRTSNSKMSRKSSNSSAQNDTKKETCQYSLYALVWAKLEGYPWWPAIVCNHPTIGEHVRRKKMVQVHVQFFDEPSSRAWVACKYLKPFTGPKHAEVPVQKDDKWKKAVEKAMDAMNNFTSESRNQVVAPMQPSDEEESMDETFVKSDDEDTPPNSKKRELENGVSADSSKKRSRLAFSDESESEDEFKPGDHHESSSDSGASSCVDESLISEPEGEPDVVSPLKVNGSKKRRKRPSVSTPKTMPPKKLSDVHNSTKDKLKNFSLDDSTLSKSIENKTWAHQQLDWLKDDKRKDADGNPVSHPDYNPRTLHVPEHFKKNLTPAFRQWWKMKSKHYDTVLFFKVGKFYELYHMDAVIGFSELNLTHMKGEFAHSGFPEIAYGRYSATLIERGYKVARVEQTETPLMMEERCKHLTKTTKFDKVVNREICSITSKGTCTFNFLDGKPAGAENNYLLSLTEKETSSDSSMFGVCFVDTSIGKFYLGQFADDRHCSKLRTLIAHYPPVQILYDRDVVSVKTQQIFSGCLGSVLKESLRSGSEFWDSSKTIKFLTNGGYFADQKDADGKTNWPETLKKMLNPDDPLLLSAAESCDLAIKSLGGCVWYLQDCFKEEELLSMKNFEEYLPADYEGASRVTARVARSNMVLDGVTLRNLEILENTLGTTEGSLLDTMDFCNTQFGKRLFRHWLCSPSCDPSVIDDRLNAVENLRLVQDVVQEVTKLMKKLPDFERLLSKIHTQGSARRSKSHPDSRAIFYEDETYSKRKIADLLSALQGFHETLKILDYFEKKSEAVTSEILQKCVTKQTGGGNFPELKNTLDFFDNAFDHEKARTDGKIIPSRGVDAEFDDAEKDLKDVKCQLDKYLEEQKRHFGCKVTYFGSGKTRFQIEVPESFSKHASDKYELQSQKKGYKRYWTSEVKQLLAKMVCAEDHRNAALRDIMRRIFENFDKNYKKWESAVQCMSVLDVLLSLMQYSISSPVAMCRPNVLHPEDANGIFLEIRQGRHPSLLKHFAGDDFIPNDVCIGDYGSGHQSESPLVLVTGPNMGGKSTLMRQAGLLAVMAQMGSYVPAEKCRLTAVDRIFTRLGASDRIMLGESTFFVELSETATILQHASKHSLVILDELGRGTATYDGTAIACSVVKELATNISCLTLFSTHYHCLVDEFSKDKHVKLGHMACMVENESEDPTQEMITFLYKFMDGACPKSYGFNAARLAGIPNDVIRKGYNKAKRFEEEFETRKRLRLLMSCTSVKELQRLQSL